MTTLKAAVFDFDGTLCDTIPDIAAAGNYALEQQGLATHKTEAYRDFVGEGVYNMCRNFLPADRRAHEFIEPTRRIYKEYYAAHMSDLTKPYPGVGELLAALKKRGIKLGVLSNKDDKDTKDLCEKFFPGVFDIVLGAREGVPVKPDPAAPLELAGVLELATREILFVGDSEYDMLTAKNAGMAGCGVLWGYRGKEVLQKAGAAFLAASAADIEKLF